MKAGQPSVLSLAVYINNNAFNAINFKFCFRFSQFITTDAAGCLLIPSFLHSPPPLLFFWDSSGSSITQTKTKGSMRYNSVRHVQVEDYRLYTGVSLWCPCGTLYRYIHTHTHRYAKVTKQRVIWPWRHIKHHGACSTGKRQRGEMLICNSQGQSRKWEDTKKIYFSAG